MIHFDKILVMKIIIIKLLVIIMIIVNSLFSFSGELLLLEQISKKEISVQAGEPQQKPILSGVEVMNY